MPQTDKHIDLNKGRKYIHEKYGRRLCFSTIFRYCVKGMHGVRLNHVRVGKAIRLTTADIDTFFAQLADAYADSLAKPATTDGSSAHEQAEAELEAAGV